MRVAFSTILSVSFAASALAIPMGKKRHEELEIKTEYIVLATTIYATVDPPAAPTPSNPPVEPDSDDVLPEWWNWYDKPETTTCSTSTAPEPTAPQPTAPEPTIPEPTVPEPTAPEPTTPPAPITPTETTTPPPPSVPTTTSPPAPPPMTTPTPPVNDDSFEAVVLAAHNEKRALHGVPSLTYDATLANFAKGVSETCVMKHSGGPYGENLAAGYPNSTAAIHAWYDEKAKYNYATGEYNSEVGHFVQMIWKNAQKLGCATVPCNGANGIPGNFLTCNYDYMTTIGEVIENVLPPI